MPELIFSEKFDRRLRDFLEKHPELQEIVKQKLVILQQNPRDRRLKIHKLSGKFKGMSGVRITYEYRLIFYWEKSVIYLVAIGTHDEVY